MKKSIELLENGFESSSGLTPEFKHFYNTFKKEMKFELQCIGAKDIVFSRGHFYVSGFFTVGEQVWYFSLGDVRGMEIGLKINPESCMNKLMYRTAKDYKDYTGGQNRYVKIEPLMVEKMCWSFKLV